MEVHKAILFFESPYFHPMLTKFGEARASEVAFEEWDEEIQVLTLTYLESSDIDRQQFIDDLTVDRALQLLLSANLWLITDLVSACDKVLAKELVLNKEYFEFFEDIDLTPFPFLKTRVSLCRLISNVELGKQPFDGAVQNLARNCLDFTDGHSPLSSSFCDIEFNKENIESLFAIATKFKSLELLKLCFEFEASLISLPLKKSESNEYYSYGPGDPGLQVFRDAPCNAEGVQLFLFPQRISDALLSLLEKYRDLSFGLSLNANQIKELADLLCSKMMDLPSVILLNMIAGSKEKSLPELDAFQTVVQSQPDLKILVVPEEFRDLLYQQEYADVLKQLPSIWKNLSGTASFKTVYFDQRWAKVPDIYAR